MPARNRLMYKFLKSRWILITVLLLFVLFKIPHLLLPFYWDESWPYASAVRQMYHNGISLLPNAIDPNLSRGHPMFFHFMYGLWMNIFGSSNFALHSFALLISLLFLITIYETGLRVFNQRVGVLGLVLVATYVPFFVQSSFVLPEIMVAFLAFLSIVLYVRERYILATISLTALFFTKESGLIVGFVLGTDALISLFNTKTEIRKRLQKLMPATVACIFIGLFFILQKHITGWYVLPLYTDTILVKWEAIWDRFGTGVIHADFCMGFEYILFFTMFAYSVVLLFTQKKVRYIIPLLLIVLIITAYYLEYPRIINLYGQGSGMFIITYVVFFGFIGIYLSILFFFKNKEFNPARSQRQLILLTGLFILAFSLFSSVAYFIPRYVLASGIAVLFLVAVVFEILIRYTWNPLYYVLIIIILFSSFLSFKNSTGWGDEEMGFVKGVKTQVAEVEYMEANNFYDKHIYVNSFMGYTHLRDPYCGFLKSGKIFKYTLIDLLPTTDLIMYDNVEDIKATPGYYLSNPDFMLIHKITYGDKWAEFYKRK